MIGACTICPIRGGGQYVIYINDKGLYQVKNEDTGEVHAEVQLSDDPDEMVARALLEILGMHINRRTYRRTDPVTNSHWHAFWLELMEVRNSLESHAAVDDPPEDMHRYESLGAM
jgi:hypothetical protein